MVGFYCGVYVVMEDYDYYSGLPSVSAYNVPKRQWHSLTEAEIGEIYRKGWSNNMDFARAIEKKLREKNEGVERD